MPFYKEEYYDNFDDYESYEIQLKSHEWKQKRKAILKRDNHTCVKCNNYNVFKKSLPYFFHSFGTNPADKTQFFATCPLLDDTKQFSIPFHAFIKIKNIESSIFFWHQVKSDLILAAIFEKEPPNNLIYFSNSLLEVHHTYYEQGCRAWEYPDEALQTLCWYCHQETHKSSPQR